MARFTLRYRLPYNGLNPDVTAKCEAKVFSVTRQVYFSSVNHKSLGVVTVVGCRQISCPPWQISKTT